MKQRSLLLPLLFAGLSAVAQQPVKPVLDSNAVKNLFFAGLREKLNENYSKAGESFNKILTIDPNNAAVHYEIASLNYRQNKLEDAEVSIKKSVALDADNLWYWKLLAELYKRKGNMEGLVTVFTQMIRLSPDNDAYYFDKSNAYLLMGKTEEALKGYDLLEQKFGPSKALTQARQRITLGTGKAATKQEVDKILAEGQDDVKDLLEMSESLMEKGQHETALPLLLKAKTVAPEDYEVDLALADYYRNSKNSTAAGQALRTAFANSGMPAERKIKIVMMLAGGAARNKARTQEAGELAKIMVESNPSDPKAQALYGDILYQQGNLSAALEQYQAVLKKTEDLYAVWEQVLNIQTSLGLYKEAVKTGDAAMGIYPNQAIIYYYTAFALHRDNQNAAALSNIKTALQLDGDNKDLQALILGLQGEILIDEQKFSEANAAFDKAVALAPTNYLLLNNYAFYLALRNQHLAKAESLIAKAAAAMPGNPSVADTYALVLLKLEKYDQAKVWAEQALQSIGAKNGLYLEHYGDILFLKGEKELALVQWQKAKEAGNDSGILNRKINEKKYIK
ncbi:Flp pilus assembly protein TadD, contains TPR repeats [Pedobacter steynii]|uniref:Flp pilus assembly protein TadD, contains TPR repeats n=1 Tax=Pedobacter steynii TaxID=430522 RepID=A0A1G9WQK1_9SPHI|nr:tetratricopeptide repeat protein [Pedobacter steynii]NQX40358.1 tetratricopeptide repeat protein [Pedobacter steynii]SDM86463.1 Flp pilus assembly protein TadD, contains TPR repeats [Pedobacter steynii]